MFGHESSDSFSLMTVSQPSGRGAEPEITVSLMTKEREIKRRWNRPPLEQLLERRSEATGVAGYRWSKSKDPVSQWHLLRIEGPRVDASD